MFLPLIIVFTPVPGRQRRDAWSPALQQRFIEALTRGAAVAEAARRLGKNRQAAYALRRRAGAESFAQAWDSAVAAARPLPSPLLPAAAQAVVLAERGYNEICAALPRSHDAARVAFEKMLDGIYGQHPSPPLESDTHFCRQPLHAGSRNRRASSPSVALASAPLKRRSC